MKRNPMVGDVLCIGNSPVEHLVVSIDDKIPQSTDLVFNVVPFSQDQPMVNPTHTAYVLSWSDNVIGCKKVYLLDLHFVKSVKFKRAGTTYTFQKVNK